MSRWCTIHNSSEEEPSGRCYRYLHDALVRSDCDLITVNCIGCIDGPCNPWCERLHPSPGGDPHTAPAPHTEEPRP